MLLSENDPGRPDSRSAERRFKPVAADLKRIYQSATQEEAQQALNDFAQRWDDKYPQISKSWKANWHNLNTLFAYPPDIRKAIYTTNAIESLNRVIRKAIKKRKLFPNDDSARKVVYLVGWGRSLRSPRGVTTVTLE